MVISLLRYIRLDPGEHSIKFTFFHDPALADSPNVSVNKDAPSERELYHIPFLRNFSDSPVMQYTIFPLYTHARAIRKH